MTTRFVDPLPAHALVAVLGYGASGRAATNLLRAMDKRVWVSDRQGAPDREDPGVVFRFGENSVGDASVAILSPGLNPEWPENANNPALAQLWARVEAGELRLMSEVELGLRAFGRPWIGIGGTDGKSTTAAMTHHLALAFGERTALGGNSWEAFSAVALEADAATTLAVAEVSAFQLHRPHGMKPKVAILTNIARDHLDHYASFDDYVRAKEALFMNQAEGDWAVLNADDPVARDLGLRLEVRGVGVAWFANGDAQGAFAAGERGDELVLRFQGQEITAPFSALSLAGAHNRRNALAASLALTLALGRLPDADAWRARLGNFKGLPHRVAFVREHRGVRYFNDSKATNVHAACIGIHAMDRPTVAIVGGVDKRLDLAPLFEALAARTHTIVAIGELREGLRALCPSSIAFVEAESMDAAVSAAASAARSGDAVLLAPASSSFDMFKSFEHRGELFEAAVRALS